MNDDAESGFTLLEMVCVLAIIAMLAAVLLPLIPRQTSRSRLQAYALEAATLLKADRNVAIRRQGEVATFVDAGTRSIHSGAKLSAGPSSACSVEAGAPAVSITKVGISLPARFSRSPPVRVMRSSIEGHFASRIESP